MNNLLPEKNKNKIIAEYKARLFFVASVLFFVLVVVLIIFQVLLYISISEKKLSLLNDLNRYSTKSSDGDKKLSSEINNINKKILVLKSNNDNKLIYNDVFNAITQKRNNIKIIGMSYEKNKSRTKIRVSGESSNRESIVNFVDALNKEGFKKIDLPVSNFVKNKNIKFSIEITL